MNDLFYRFHPEALLTRLRANTISYSDIPDSQLDSLEHYLDGKISFHESFANAEWWADIPVKITWGLGPKFKSAGIPLQSGGKVVFDPKFSDILQAKAELAIGAELPNIWDRDFYNLIKGYSYEQHLNELSFLESVKNSISVVLETRAGVFPGYTGGPLDAPYLNYNGNRRDDYIGDTQFVKTVEEQQAEYWAGLNQCFPAGIQVSLENGSTQTIEDIRVGDIVASFSENSQGRGELSGKRVVRLFENVTDTWIELSNGLTVTPGHRFFWRLMGHSVRLKTFWQMTV